jgi:hypothetical protein
MQVGLTVCTWGAGEHLQIMEDDMEMIFGLIILIADIWAIINVVQSGATTGMKVLWVILIIVLPVIGLLLWFLMGPKRAIA